MMEHLHPEAPPDHLPTTLSKHQCRKAFHILRVGVRHLHT